MRQISYQDYRELVCDVEDKEAKYVNDKPIVIDFFATWCGPCKAMEPALKRVSEEFGDKVDFYKMDVDEQGVSKLATLFKMRSVPTIAYIKPGGEYTLSVGALPETTLKERIRTTFEL